jgi:hypothetical protein
MDKFQAEQAADTFRSPELQAQEDRLNEQSRAEFAQGEKRKIAWAGLLGFGVGAAIAHYLGEPIIRGGFGGTMTFGLIASFWVLARIRKQSTNATDVPTQETGYEK